MNNPTARPTPPDPTIILGRSAVLALLCLASAPDLMAGNATGALGTILFEVVRWVDAIAGPFFTAFSIIAIIVAGLVLMFVRISQGAQWIIRAVLGILLAANAATLVTDLGASGATF